MPRNYGMAGLDKAWLCEGETGQGNFAQRSGRIPQDASAAFWFDAEQVSAFGRIGPSRQ